MSNSLWPWTVARQTPLSMEFLRQGVCCHSLLQGSSQPGDRTRVCMVGGFFTIWATREWVKREQDYHVLTSLSPAAESSIAESGPQIAFKILHSEAWAWVSCSNSLSLKDMMDVQYFQSFLKGIVIFQTLSVREGSRLRIKWLTLTVILNCSVHVMNLLCVCFLIC